MPAARESPGVATGTDGRIYVIGGYAPGGQYVASVEAYDPLTNSWAIVAPMPTARANLAAVATPDGRIYAIGGSGAADPVATALDNPEREKAPL